MFPCTQRFYYLNGLNIGGHQIDIGSVSVEEFDNQDVSIYPNPTFDFINIENIEESSSAIIFNVLGQKVSELESSAKIDVRNLPEGICFLKIGNRNLTKFINNRPISKTMKYFFYTTYL